MSHRMMHVNSSEVTKTFGGNPVAIAVIAPCHGVGFEYKHRPKRGETSDAALVVNPRPVKNGGVLPCLSCGEQIGPNSCEPEGGWAQSAETQT